MPRKDRGLFKIVPAAGQPADPHLQTPPAPAIPVSVSLADARLTSEEYATGMPVQGSCASIHALQSRS
jgi:hypothetical protein